MQEKLHFPNSCFTSSAILNIGRVDHRTSHFDRDETEMKRGITIFAD